MKSAPTIAFDYRPSRRIGAAAAAVCVCAVLAPWLSGLPLPARVMLSLFALAAGSHALWRFLHPPFRRAAFRESGWLLVDTRGEEHPALLESHAHLGALLALSLRYAPRARFRVLLAPDNLDAGSRRRLVAMLARAEVVQAG
ncbi:hypothetical protein [Dokdonella soli]|uniref:Toxin CptA n=1 Tax=Dokdonella soli TaxID=529810 RepID=A0ABP3TKQ5_9GAMM